MGTFLFLGFILTLFTGPLGFVVFAILVGMDWHVQNQRHQGIDSKVEAEPEPVVPKQYRKCDWCGRDMIEPKLEVMDGGSRVLICDNCGEKNE